MGSDLGAWLRHRAQRRDRRQRHQRGVPAVGQRVSGFVVLLLLASRASARLLPNADLRPWLLASGVFAALSTIFYLVGLEIDAPSTVITASLFPAMSVIVGRAIYHDHVAGHQVAGLGIVLIGMLGVGLG